MNFHTDEWIMAHLHDHYEEALQHFPEDRIVLLALQGSQNYQLDTKNSDIDSKLVLTPTLDDICFNRKAVSTTHIRENEEHIDFKDIRLMIQTFKKQNLNFVEILFTPYKIVNPMYADLWNKLVENNEAIARYNPYAAVKTMKGIAMEKYHAMEHEYPSKMAILAEHGYDPKQLHHLLRVEEYLQRYIAGEKYADCLISEQTEMLQAIKHGILFLNEARVWANRSMNHITEMADNFCAENPSNPNEEVSNLLDQVQVNIVKRSILQEVAQDD